MKAIKQIIDGRRVERELSESAFAVFREWNHERKWAPLQNIGSMIEFLGDDGLSVLLRRHSGLPPVDALCDALWELTKEKLREAEEQGTLWEFLGKEVPENRQVRYFQTFPDPWRLRESS